MDLFAILQWTGLPRDVIELINRFVSYRGIPFSIGNHTIIGGADISSCYGQIFGMYRYDYRGSCTIFYDIEKNEIISERPGALTFELISEKECIVYNGAGVQDIKMMDITTLQFITIPFDGIVNYRKFVLIEDEYLVRTLDTTNTLFYTSSTFAMECEYRDSRDRILVAGGNASRHIVPPGPKIEFSVELCYPETELYQNFAIIYNGSESSEPGKNFVVFKDGEIIDIEEACRFDNDSVIYKKDGVVYYKHIGWSAIPIDWPSDIDLINIAIYGDKIAYTIKRDTELYIGEISYK